MEHKHKWTKRQEAAAQEEVAFLRKVLEAGVS